MRQQDTISTKGISRDGADGFQGGESFRLMADALPVLISYIDRDHYYRFNNATFDRWMNIPPRSALNRHVRDIFGEEAYRIVRPYLDAVLAGQPIQFNRQYTFPDGVFRYVHARYIPHVVDNEVIGLYSLISDESEEREREEQFRDLAEQRRLALELAELGTWTFDLEANEMIWDERGRQINGVGDRLRFPLSEAPNVVHPDDLPLVNRAFEQALDPARRALYKLEHRIVWPDGSVHWVAAQGKAVFDGEGPEARPLRVVGTVMDITEQKEAEEALRERGERFRAIFDQTSVGIVQVDLTGRIVLANPRYCELVGRSAQQLMGMKMQDYTHPDDLPHTLKHFNAISVNRQNYSLEKRYLRPDGSIVWVAISASLVKSPEGIPLYVLAVAKDITDRKQADELRRSNRDLEQFASVASHDLKEPLRKVQTFSSLLADEYGPVLDEGGKFYLERVQQAAHRMQGLIDHLLAYSRLSSSEPSFRRVVLQHLVKDVVSDLEVSLTESGGRIETGELPAVEADPLQMRQLFQNLIGNALKFNRKGVPPVIRIASSPDPVEQDGRVMAAITIIDNGIGIEEKYLEEIFEPFRRLHGRSQYEGAGMGLAICRRIVERHHGTIHAQSTPGEGSTFIFTLPLM
jgi:PAS domain S-box-containing protein